MNILNLSSNQVRVPFTINRAAIYYINLYDASTSWSKSALMGHFMQAYIPFAVSLFCCFIPSTSVIVYSALSHAFIYYMFLSTWDIPSTDFISGSAEVNIDKRLYRKAPQIKS